MINPMTSLRASRAFICGLILAFASGEGRAIQPTDSSRSVKVGVLVSLSGSWSSLGKNTVAALRVAADDLGSKSPAPDRFQFLVRDTQLDPARALQAIKGLYRSGVTIVIGPQSSAEVAMIKPFADAHKMLVISQGSTASSLAIPGDNIFRFCPNDTREAPAVVALMRRDGISAIVPLWRNDRGNNGLHDSVKKAFEAVGGTVAQGYRYETSTTDFSTATSDVSQQVDALVTGGTPQSEIAVYCAAFDEVVDVFHSAQSLPTLTSTAWYGSDGVALSAALTGDASAAAFAANAGYPNPSFGLKDSLAPKWRPVSNAIRKRTGIAPDAFAVSVYDALFVVSDALRKTNGVRNFSRFKAAFLRQSRHFSGVTGSTALDAGGDRRSSDFDFWAVRSVNGSTVWVRTGTYHDGILKVF
jgi:branched-chain amino acid transport system substrate-binding protein